MLHIELDSSRGLAILKPEGVLTQTDFEEAAKLFDPVIEADGKLNGLIIYSESFPGWESFAVFEQHRKWKG